MNRVPLIKRRRSRWVSVTNLVIILVLLLVAWGIRQTHGAVFLELFGLLSRPFTPERDPYLTTQLSNQRLLELQAKTTELEQQNHRLKQLLGYVTSQSAPVIAAPVIGRSPDEWTQYAILGRGSQDGVQVNNAVMGIGGLVGRIMVVTPHSSRLLLISDPNSSAGVTVSRSRALGYLQGKDSTLALMKFYEKVPDVKPGDFIVTSPVSRLFPPGLPVGRVKSVNLESGTVPEATIELTADIDRLESVAIHLKTGSHE